MSRITICDLCRKEVCGNGIFIPCGRGYMLPPPMRQDTRKPSTDLKWIPDSELCICETCLNKLGKILRGGN